MMDHIRIEAVDGGERWGDSAGFDTGRLADEKGDEDGGWKRDGRPRNRRRGGEEKDILLNGG